MIRRAATSYERPDDNPSAAILCVHALDDQDLPLCRSVKSEDLTDESRPWVEWPEVLRCDECQRLADRS